MRAKLLAMGKRGFKVGEWYRFNKESLYLYVVSSHAPYECRNLWYFMKTHAQRYYGPIDEPPAVRTARDRAGGAASSSSSSAAIRPVRHGYTRAWVPLDMGFLSRDMRELWFMKMRFMGRRGLAVSEEYRYIEGSATEYEVIASAPLKYRDVLYFCGTQAIRYQGLISREMVPDGEEEVNVPAARAVVSPLPMRDLRTSSGQGRIVRVAVADPVEGGPLFTDELHDE